MFQTLSHPLKTSACWHSKCFISKLLTYPCVRACSCVCVCVPQSLSQFKVSAVCCQEIYASVATLWLTQCGGVFPLRRPCGWSTLILPQKKQTSSVAAVQVSSCVHGHHVKLQELSRCFGLLFLGLFNHGVLLPKLEGHGQISALLTTPRKKKISSSWEKKEQTRL